MLFKAHEYGRMASERIVVHMFVSHLQGCEIDSRLCVEFGFSKLFVMCDCADIANFL